MQAKAHCRYLIFQCAQNWFWSLKKATPEEYKQDP